MKGNESSVEEWRALAAKLLARDVVSIKSIGGGRNSRIFLLECLESARFVLKAYFRHQADGRDRLEAEFSSLNYLWVNGFRDVPRPIAAHRELDCALYEYIDGKSLSLAEITQSEIDSAIHFMTRVHNLSRRPESHRFGPASEACFSAKALIENLQFRLERLFRHQNHTETSADLRAFLIDQFVPTFEKIARWSRTHYEQAGMSFDRELDCNDRTLSPSDFGFHNALRRHNGQIVFLDFEYFGWDDPAKSAADFLLHPAMTMSEDLKRRFVAGFLDCHDDDPHLTLRIESLYPLYGLKWCLILLNEFLPEHLLRRRFANADEFRRRNVQTEQLKKAKNMLLRVNQEYGHFPYLG